MLSLPLAKLSVAQDTEPAEQKFKWDQETRDLIFILDSYGARGSSQRMKVVQGTQVRQTIEVENLINQGNEMTRMMQERGVQMQADQLPISAIVRSPLLAVRWQLPNNKIRRAQFKFKSDADFDMAHNQLLRLGLRMTSSPAGQAQSRSATPSPERASTIQPNLAAVSCSEQPIRGGLSCPPSRLAEISNRPYTATNAPTSLESQLQETAHARPMSAATGYAREERSVYNSLSGPLAPPVYFARPNSATSDVLGRTSHTISPLSRDYHTSTTEEFPRESSERPETAMLFNRPDTAESLPPRRELPFQRLSEPRSVESDSGRPRSRPSTALMGPPPLPARVADLRPSSSRGTAHEPELPPLPQPTVITKTMPSRQDMHKPPRTPDQDQNTFLRSRTSPHDGCEKLSPLTSSPTSSSSPLSFKRSSSTALPIPPPLTTPSNAAENLRRTMSQNTPATPPTSTWALHDLSTSTIPAPRQTGDDNLAAYAMQSDEGRRAALNEFIFRQLESDDFLTLVEDMEASWARVALGMI